MASDIKLDPNTHDIDISTQRVELFTVNEQVVAQRIKISLLLRAGEWFEDTSLGVPYLQFSRFKNNKTFADSILTSEIRKVEDVEELLEYESEVNSERVLEVSFSVKTTGGEIVDLTLEI